MPVPLESLPLKNLPLMTALPTLRATWAVTTVPILPGIAVAAEVIPTMGPTIATAVENHSEGLNGHLVQMHMRKCQRCRGRIRVKPGACQSFSFFGRHSIVSSLFCFLEDGGHELKSLLPDCCCAACLELLHLKEEASSSLSSIFFFFNFFFLFFLPSWNTF